MAANVLPYRPTSLRVALQWLTQLHLAYNGEKRDQLRPVPNCEMQFGFQLSDSEIRYSQTVIGQNSDDMLMPDWRYEQFVQLVRVVDAPNPTVITFDVRLNAWPGVSVGSEVMLYSSKTVYEVVTVTAVSGTTVTIADDPDLALDGWTVVPLYDAVVNVEPNWSFVGNTTMNCFVTMITSGYRDLSGLAPILPMYNGDIILSRIDYAVSDNSVSVQLPTTTVNNRVGAIRNEQVQQRRLVGRFHTESIKNQVEMLTAESTLHVIAGMVTPFYKPSHLPDFIPTNEPIIDRQNIITVANPKNISDEIKYILITQPDGNEIPAQVDGVAVVSNNLVLQLSELLTFDPTADNISKISAMELHRFDTDAIDIGVGAGITAQISIPTREVNL